MKYSTFFTEVKDIIEKRLDQPYNLSGAGTEWGVKVEVPSGSKVKIVLLKEGDEISITTEDEQGQSSFNVPSNTGLVAVDAILRVL